MLKIIKTVFNTFIDWTNIYNKPSTYSPSNHTQDISTINSLQDELDAKLSSTTLNTHKTSSDHDGRYYTEMEIDTKLSDKQDSLGFTPANISGSKTQDFYVKKLGVGTDTPSYAVDVKGTDVTDVLNSDIGINFYQVSDPPPPTLALIADASGLLGVGVYNYRVTFITALGETHTSGTTAITTDASNKKVLVTIPVSEDARVTGRKIYRSSIGGGSTNEKLLTTINNNNDLTYTDNIADASLGATRYWGANTTCRQIMVNGARSMLLDGKATIVGSLAGVNLTSGGEPTLFGSGAGWKLTSGSYNTLVGQSSGNAITTGSSNTAIGRNTLYKITTTSNNIAVGMNSLEQSTAAANMTCVGRSSGASSVTGTSCIFLGFESGYWETTSNKLFIDNQRRTNEADARVKALIYGGFDASTANQFININGALQALSYKSSDGSIGATGSFTTTDGKTITVKNGLITNIS